MEIKYCEKCGIALLFIPKFARYDSITAERHYMLEERCPNWRHSFLNLLDLNPINAHSYKKALPYVTHRLRDIGFFSKLNPGIVIWKKDEVDKIEKKWT